MRSTKIFLACIFLSGSAACGLWPAAENADSDAPQISEEIKTAVPFESKEPETFQTEIVITAFLNGEKEEKVYFVARSGTKSLTVFDRGAALERAVLNDGAKTFFLDAKNKTFREAESVSNNASPPDEAFEFLTTRWLSRKTDANFEKISAENNLTSYRIRLAETNASEIVLTYDETIKLPVRQEFYSTPGGERILTMTVELKDFQTSADEKLFVLPQDYKRALKK